MADLRFKTPSLVSGTTFLTIASASLAKKPKYGASLSLSCNEASRRESTKYRMFIRVLIEPYLCQL